MRSLIHVAVIGIITVILTAVLKKGNRELALLLSLSACVLISIALLNIVKPVITFFHELRQLAGLSSDTLAPLLKTIGIGLLTQISASLCSDAGENAIAGLIEVCGGFLALYVSLPLMRAVIEMVQRMSGG